MKFGCIIAPNSGSLYPYVGLGSSFRFGAINTFVRLHTKCTCTVKVVTHTLVWRQRFDYSSITVQRNCMKFGVVITPNSGCFSLLLED